MTFPRVAVVGLVGLLAVGLLAALLGVPQDELVELVVIAGGAALVTGLLGALTVRLLRGRSFTAQVVVVALTSTSAVTAGVLAGSNAMIFDARDLRVLFIVVAVGAVVSVIAALLLGERVGAASRSLGVVASQLGDVPDERTTMESGPVPAGLIAEFRQLADTLEATRLELDDSRRREHATDQARRELVSWVSHDLRTPLSGIRAVTELLEDGMVTDPDEVRAYYATLRREADKLTRLVQDLFEVSRIEAGALRIDPVEIDLADLVTDTVAGIAPVADGRDVDVLGEVAAGTPPIRAGQPELARILRNLVSNAVRESVDGGRVVVAAEVTRGLGGVRLAVLRVTDSCGGIPETVIDRVFDASYRGESARTPRSEGGGGLGLAIAKGFVEAHGGTIEVVNVDGGCQFTVTVPSAPDPAVLAVDDEPLPPLPLSDRGVTPG